MFRLKAASLVGCMLMLFSLAMCIWFLWVELPRMRAINGSNGRIATGTVTAKSETVVENSHTFEASILFQDEAKRIHVITDNFSKQTWDNLSRGDPITVKYISNDPGYALAVSSLKAHRSAELVPLICAGLFVFGGIVMFASRFTR